MEFIFDTLNGYINSYNGYEINPETKDTFARRKNILFYPEIIRDDNCYMFDVELKDSKLSLVVFKCDYEHGIQWNEVYRISIDKKFKIEEKGDLDLEFWHEFFGSSYALRSFNEYDVNLYSFTKDPMKVIRKLFPVCLQLNPFIFFEKYKKIKKIDIAEYPHEWFDNIPAVKVNRNVGKNMDNTKRDTHIRHFGWQREIQIHGKSFFDVTVISGMVTDGLMDIEEKHRFFITKDFVYSPDGGDAAILIDKNFYGIMFSDKMEEENPDLMLNVYKGNNYYQYFFARHLFPAFEIPAKAGMSHFADIIFKEYQNNINSHGFYDPSKDEIESINLFGKNDKQIFGIKLNKLRFIENLSMEKEGSFKVVMQIIKKLNKTCPAVLDLELTDSLFAFIEKRFDSPTIVKELNYLKDIGEEKFNLYYDYLISCKLANRCSGGLFPKNLKYHHDVMVEYLKEVRAAETSENFKLQVNSNSYIKNIYKGDKYCIFAPRTAQDLVNESYSLSHCVRTYVKRVSSGSSLIYFMRKTEQKSKPLVTIEVTPSSYIVQARGKANRDLTPEEYKFLTEWARSKNLIVSLNTW